MVNSMKQAGFKMTSGTSWNLLWTGPPSSETVRNACEYQKINHFPGSEHLGRKDLMWRNISKMIRKFGE